MAQMSWEYIAGFFDGEGHVSLNRQQKNGEGQFSRGNPRVTLVQAHERGKNLLEEISLFLTENAITSVVEIHDDGEHRSKCYRLRITGFRGVVPFLTAVFPYLRIKKLEAQDILRYDLVFPTLVGKGHSHRSNVLKAWVTRRARYGTNGYRDPSSPQRNGSKGNCVRWSNGDQTKAQLDR